LPEVGENLVGDFFVGAEDCLFLPQQAENGADKGVDVGGVIQSQFSE